MCRASLAKLSTLKSLRNNFQRESIEIVSDVNPVNGEILDPGTADLDNSILVIQGIFHDDPIDLKMILAKVIQHNKIRITHTPRSQST